jgi:hypothetical protein
MQTHVQVVTTSKESLRAKIVKDPKLGDYFEIIKKQKPGRSPGWARLRSTDASIQGTIQIVWDAKTQMLLCTIVNKAEGRPADIVGVLVRYLLSSRFSKKILVINIISQKG